VAMTKAVILAAATDPSDHDVRTDATVLLRATVTAFVLPLHTLLIGDEDEGSRDPEYNKRVVEHCIALEETRKIPRQGILRMCTAWLTELSTIEGRA